MAGVKCLPPGAENLSPPRTIVKLYWGLFWQSGLLFGLGWAVGVWFLSVSSSGLAGVIEAFLRGLLTGVFFGGAMSIALGTMHLLGVGLATSEVSAETLGIDRIASIELQVPCDVAFELSVETVRGIKGARMKETDRASGNIHAREGSLFGLGGNMISVDVREVDESRTRVKVTVRPVGGPSAAVDYGSNAKILKRAISYLWERGGSAPLQALP